MDEEYECPLCKGELVYNGFDDLFGCVPCGALFHNHEGIIVEFNSEEYNEYEENEGYDA